MLARQALLHLGNTLSIFLFFVFALVIFQIGSYIFFRAGLDPILLPKAPA
jgi:hypothetical protein